MIPKEILKNYLKKQIDTEVKRQLRYLEKNDSLYTTKLDEVLNISELVRVESMLVNVYDLRSSQIKVMIWELLGTNSYPTFEDWVTNISSKSEIINDINKDNFNEMRFKMREIALK